MSFPHTRLRRLRKTAALRALTNEVELSPRHFVQPLFVTEDPAQAGPITSMPGVERHSLEQTVEEAGELQRLGISAVLLFGVPSHKDDQGSTAYDEQGVVQQTVRALKQAYPGLVVITDVCLCDYTTHGHCGYIRPGEEHVDNDITLELIAQVAVSHALAGADMVAPSDMMDGNVQALRAGLDGEGHIEVPIMGYSAKFASAFYGPFRQAINSSPQFGDRRTHQMSPANGREALREVQLDIEDGVDIVMVKPALPYLDVILRVAQATTVPIAAYNVSGEYAQVKAAASQGWIDERAVVLETFTSIHRAGAQMIISYHAKDAARWLQ